MLFLDEFTEFRRDAVEGLRQPLEEGRVVVTPGETGPVTPDRPRQRLGTTLALPSEKLVKEEWGCGAHVVCEPLLEVV